MTKKEKILNELVKRNGRFIEYRKDGVIYTGDKYDNCDGHYFDNIDDAINWEKGYR